MLLQIICSIVMLAAGTVMLVAFRRTRRLANLFGGLLNLMLAASFAIAGIDRQNEIFRPIAEMEKNIQRMDAELDKSLQQDLAPEDMEKVAALNDEVEQQERQLADMKASMGLRLKFAIRPDWPWHIISAVFAVLALVLPAVVTFMVWKRRRIGASQLA